MKKDIRLIQEDAEGNITFHLHPLMGFVIGSEKLIQDILRYLYSDNGGSLVSLIGNANLTSADIIQSIVNTEKYIKDIQEGKNLDIEEMLVRIDIKQLDINKTGGEVNLFLDIVTAKGSHEIRI